MESRVISHTRTRDTYTENITLASPTKNLQTMTLSQKSNATIAALAPLFTTSAGQPAISPPLTLWPAIQTAYATALSTFSLPQDPATSPLSQPGTPALVTNAVFDTDARLFFEEAADAASLFASLTPAAKARLLAQAIAGIVLFFARLGGALEEGEGVVSESLLARELELFRGAEERQAALNGLEWSRVWEACARPEEVARVVGRVVDRASDEAEVGELVEAGAMGFDVERPRNMGLPWGFSILPVN
ncbi:hypothetical protein VUR80DRAFT_4366 [Thermomyces stellatus]